MKRIFDYRLVTTIAAAIISCGSMKANAFPGTILGIFSNPVLAGSIANDPTLGQATFLDNTNTATYSINNSTDPALGGTPLQQSTGSALNWGSFGGSGATGNFSSLIFFGNQIPNVSQGQPFQLGTLTFTNGTSDLSSLIFGATLSFYDNSVSPSTFLGSDQVVITTTSNVAGGPPLDDDYINICGNGSNICASSIEAVESTEGGNGLTVNLMGIIIGDPMLQVTTVNLAAGQDGTANGFIGSDLPIGADTPEPGTLKILAAAMALGLGLARWRSQKSRNLARIV